MGDRWGSGGPPDDAYGRVTDGERFAALHVVGHHLLDDLESRFAVTRHVGTRPDRHGDRPAEEVRLVPADPAAAALTMIFTGFPGLQVEVDGRAWTAVPNCGCDACDETVAECVEQLCTHLDAVVAGGVGERLVRASATGWMLERWHRTATGGGSNRRPVTGDELAALRRRMPGGEQIWAPWGAR